MKNIYKPLRNNWLHPEITKDEIQERVDSESWYNNCKGYPSTEFEDKINILCPRIYKLQTIIKEL